VTDASAVAPRTIVEVVGVVMFALGARRSPVEPRVTFDVTGVRVRF
jgi:hypothetical protein